MKKCFCSEQNVFFFLFFFFSFLAWIVRSACTILFGELPKNVVQFRRHKGWRKDIVEVYLIPILSYTASRKFHWARLKDVRLAPNDSKYQLNACCSFFYLYFVPWRYFDFSFDTNREYYAYILCFFTGTKVLCSSLASRHTGDR